MVKKYFLIVALFLLQNTFSQSLNIFEVARKGTVEEAKALLKQDPKIFNTTNEEGYSPLILACYRGNNEVAKFLIENGIDINGSSTMGTPLMACVVKGNTEIAELLITKKADVNLGDANGTTPLIYAVQFQNKTILKLLLANKANKSHKDKEGKTAFEHAVFAGNEEIINLLK